MQITSSGWNSVVNSSYRPLNTGVLVSWNKTVASGINYFTIGTSLIEGIDIIRGDAGSTNVSFFDKYQYGDYTSKAKNWSVQRDIGQFPFGLIMAQADVEFDNTSGMFLPGVDPTIGSGILPNRPLKISAGMNQDNLQQFTGFTGQPEISITDRTLKLHAFDVMDYLNNYNFVSTSGTTFSGTLTNITTASAISYCLGILGFNANQMALDASLQSPVYYVNITDRKFGQVLQDLIYAEQALLFSDENGKINFWNRQHFNTISGLGSRFTINYNNAISIQYSNTPIINDVTVNAQPRQVSNGISAIWSLPSAVVIPANGNVTVFANFSDSDGQLPVLSVTLPIYNNVGNSYYTLDTAVANASSFITITSTYLFGTSYKIIFANSNAANISLTGMVLYGSAARVIANISQNYTHNTSVDLYGRNPSNNGVSLVINNDYIQDASSAQSLAYGIVEQYHNPNSHYDVEIFSNPALQIGDFGTIDPSGSGVYKNVWITGKTDKLSPGGNLTQLLKLEERTIIRYFTINVSMIGSSDSIAP